MTIIFFIATLHAHVRTECGFGLARRAPHPAVRAVAGASRTVWLGHAGESSIVDRQY